MNYIESQLIPALGKGMDEPAVRQAISDQGFVDIQEDPEVRTHYVGSKKRGIALLFEDNRLVDIQIFLQPSTSYSAFTDELPFGIQRGMSQDEIHKLLGEPKTFDKIDSQYSMENGRIHFYVRYDKSLLVSYLSIGLPL